MKNVYTVSQVNSYIKNMFSQDYLLVRLYVKGEVSNCKYHSSGHIYFSLKDAGGTINCVMFAGQRKGLAFSMKDGQQVIVLGSVSVYERSGSYQIYAREIIQDGAGRLYERFEQLKAELEEMGMFSPEYKQPIPAYCRKIGVVTAPTGAAVQDIRNITSRRNPYVQLILYPALVQGDGAAESIVKGIETLDALGMDVIIVGRGGGSMEDLWAFNEEIVARAIFNCRTPIISAVGHETDTTIADYAADLRAPTPSAAAELAAADISEITEKLHFYENALYSGIKNQLEQKRGLLERYRLRLARISPGQQLNEKRMQTAEMETRLRMLMEQRLHDMQGRLSIYAERLDGLSPVKKLMQGYSYVTDESGGCVSRIEQVQTGSRIKIRVSDGEIKAVVEEKIRLDR